MIPTFSRPTTQVTNNIFSKRNVGRGLLLSEVIAILDVECYKEMIYELDRYAYTVHDLLNRIKFIAVNAEELEELMGDDLLLKKSAMKIRSHMEKMSEEVEHLRSVRNSME